MHFSVDIEISWSAQIEEIKDNKKIVPVPIVFENENIDGVAVQ